MGILNLGNAQATVSVNLWLLSTCMDFYAYVPSDWTSQCSASATSRQRTVACKDVQGNVAADAMCAGLTTPVLSEPCVFSWKASSFSTCSGGSQNRTISCTSSNGETADAESRCANVNPPQLSQTCIVASDNKPSSTNGQSIAGELGQCNCVCCAGAGCNAIDVGSFAVQDIGGCLTTQCQTRYPQQCASGSGAVTSNYRQAASPTSSGALVSTVDLLGFVSLIAAIILMLVL